ncbi:MAG: pilus assembly protein PilF [Gammaproteobacteria bacterium]|nr:pilus assembly protein PilF [Gammaproteobacteria bacterium]MCI0590725.1 pilus assembly protein PilF [Gammaproteobacteria bacterium]
MRALTLLFLLVLTALVYAPGLSGGFAFDDEPNILMNERLAVEGWSLEGLKEASLSGYAGPFKRPISMLSFALNHVLGGFNPFYFKLTNLFIHLVNGVLIYALVCLLLRAYRHITARPLARETIGWLALGVTGAWLLHPLNLTAVLYVVQRMTSLSASFILLGLLCYLTGRLRQLVGKPGALWLFLGTASFGGLAILSKESGALLPLYALACESVLLRFQARRREDSYWIAAYYGLFLLAPFLMAATYLLTHPEWLTERYLIHPFDPGGRLLSEARVLWFYLAMVLVPNPVALGLFHDDIAISTGLFSPPSTLWAVLGLLLLGVLGWKVRRRATLVAFAVFWFLAGHSLESTVIPLELVHEHRNYLPALGPLIAFFYYVFLPPGHATYHRAIRFAGVALIGLYAFVTLIRADQWRHPVTQTAVEVAHHPDSPRAQYELGRIYFILFSRERNPEYSKRAREHFHKAIALDDNRNKPLFALIQLAYLNNSEPDPELLALLRERLRDKPYQVGEVIDLKFLVECQRSGRCKLGHDEVIAIFHAALANPTVSPATEALLLTWLGAYYANVMGDLARAETVLSDIVAMEPSVVRYRLNLVQLFIATGQFAKAEGELLQSESLDRLGAHRTMILNHARMLQDAMTRAKASASGEAAKARHPDTSQIMETLD